MEGRISMGFIFVVAWSSDRQMGTQIVILFQGLIWEDEFAFCFMLVGVSKLSFTRNKKSELGQ